MIRIWGWLEKSKIAIFVDYFWTYDHISMCLSPSGKRRTAGWGSDEEENSYRQWQADPPL